MILLIRTIPYNINYKSEFKNVFYFVRKGLRRGAQWTFSDEVEPVLILENCIDIMCWSYNRIMLNITKTSRFESKRIIFKKKIIRLIWILFCLPESYYTNISWKIWHVFGIKMKLLTWIIIFIWFINNYSWLRIPKIAWHIIIYFYEILLVDDLSSCLLNLGLELIIVEKDWSAKKNLNIFLNII